MTGAVTMMLGADGGVEARLQPQNWVRNGTTDTIFSGIVSCIVEPSGSYTYQWDMVGDGGISMLYPLNSPIQEFKSEGMIPMEPRFINITCEVRQGGVLVATAFGSGQFVRTA